ncbi:DUF1905 domain-containing protein [Devosia sp.]|uniref:DUF1905 domain-containing protein n=1 Tax=Devosia sp. TaxID=1871048 RepID=UPI0019E8D1A1|nr:DUF1905 domain-containing protein [Devosia sp.]MBE0579135.1 DUF1905 domain-containing protein [Devosia sp.]
MLQFSFDTTLIEWRGPAPFVYAPVPLEHAGKIEKIRKQASYGWGVIPVTAEIDGTAFTTSLFPRDGTYLLPVKQAVRKKNGITVGDAVAVTIAIGPRAR